MNVFTNDGTMCKLSHVSCGNGLTKSIKVKTRNRWYLTKPFNNEDVKRETEIPSDIDEDQKRRRWRQKRSNSNIVEENLSDRTISQLCQAVVVLSEHMSCHRQAIIESNKRWQMHFVFVSNHCSIRRINGHYRSNHSLMASFWTSFCLGNLSNQMIAMCLICSDQSLLIRRSYCPSNPISGRSSLVRRTVSVDWVTCRTTELDWYYSCDDRSGKPWLNEISLALEHYLWARDG